MWAPESHVCSKYPLIFCTSAAQRLRGEKVSSLMWFLVQLHECLSQHKEGSSMKARSKGREKVEESFWMTVVIYITTTDHRISDKSVTEKLQEKQNIKHYLETN